MTRGPQYRTMWYVERVTDGYLVRGMLDDVGIEHVFGDLHLSILPSTSCEKLRRMQRELNTAWHRRHGQSIK